MTNPGETRLSDRFFNDYTDYSEYGKDKLIFGSFKVTLEEEVG